MQGAGARQVRPARLCWGPRAPPSPPAAPASVQPGRGAGCSPRLLPALPGASRWKVLETLLMWEQSEMTTPGSVGWGRRGGRELFVFLLLLEIATAVASPRTGQKVINSFDTEPPKVPRSRAPWGRQGPCPERLAIQWGDKLSCCLRGCQVLRAPAPRGPRPWEPGPACGVPGGAGGAGAAGQLGGSGRGRGQLAVGGSGAKGAAGEGRALFAEQEPLAAG